MSSKLCSIIPNCCCISDSVDTKGALDAMRECITAANVYLDNSRKSGASPDRGLLHNIASYVTRILRIFGAIEGGDPIGFPQAGNQGAVNVSL